SGFSDLRRACESLPHGNVAAKEAARVRQDQLTKPPGSLGRIEEIACWLAEWQSRPNPRLERVEILVFAGNHGVARHGVSAYPAGVTKQMVANFTTGGAAINQLAKFGGADLKVVPLSLDTPTVDFTAGPAMSEPEFLSAVASGFDAVPEQADLV